MDQPLICPHCPRRRVLWRDTSRTGPAEPQQWVWYCAGCGRMWEPTPEQKAWRRGVPKGQGQGQRHRVR
ncbi:hypothetical protein [Streptomyces bacillaris]|uniref:hypothetical protein n=1 Tax=Streptomyces bacillaris TaxID=68179 RepID=UPI000B88D1F1